MNEEQIIGFIRAHMGSVYTLEVLLLMKRKPDRAWHSGELIRELRSSGTAVVGALHRLTAAGLIRENPGGGYLFAPATPERNQLADEIDRIYTMKPISVVKAIMTEPDEKLRAFSDAFKLKE